MATPNLKLLLNALRLGQPQDPKAAVFVLAEAIAAQDDVIDELKRRLTMLQQHAQVLETKTNRLEAELDAARSLGGASSSAHQAATQQAALHQAAQHQAAQQAAAQQAAAQQAAAHQAHQARAYASHAAEAGPASQHAPYSQHPRSQHPPPSQPPPASSPATSPVAREAPSQPPPAMTASRPPPAVPRLASEDSADEFATGTVVVRQQDVLATRFHQAPFHITPAGPHGNPQASIPGAPWARERGAQVQVPVDEFTVEAPAYRGPNPLAHGSQPPARSNEDLEDETYMDRGEQESLGDLGIAGAQPRARPRTTPRLDDDEPVHSSGRVGPGSKR